MKFSRLIKILAVLVVSSALTAFASAHEDDTRANAESKNPVTMIKADDASVSADWLAKARADYPLDTCTVSGDKFDGGDMGKPQDYVYRREGQPDRLVRFCCKDCIKDFKKDPAQYLKVVDDATAAKNKAQPAK